jgi:hypothetical protein
MHSANFADQQRYVRQLPRIRTYFCPQMTQMIADVRKEKAIPIDDTNIESFYLFISALICVICGQ